MHELSIVIPVYNGEKYIKNTINYIIELNNNVDFKIILVNDGSKDNSSYLLKNLETKYPNLIEVITKENGGIASSRNAGLSRCNSKYVCFVDQDDILFNGYRSVLDDMKSSNIEIAMCNLKYKKGPFIIDKNFVKENLIIETKEDRNSLISNLITRTQIKITKENISELPRSVWNCIFDVQFINNHNIKFKRFVDFEDDFIFITEAILNAKKILLSPNGFYCWKRYLFSESHSHKYITEVFTKLNNYRDWQESCMIKSNATYDLLDNFKTKIRKRFLLWGFYNETFSSSGYLLQVAILNKNLGSISDEEYNCFISLSNNFIEKCLLTLLKKRKYKLALILNRYVFRRHYH